MWWVGGRHQQHLERETIRPKLKSSDTLSPWNKAESFLQLAVARRSTSRMIARLAPPPLGTPRRRSVTGWAQAELKEARAPVARTELAGARCGRTFGGVEHSGCNPGGSACARKGYHPWADVRELRPAPMGGALVAGLQRSMGGHTRGRGRAHSCCWR